MTNAPTGKLRPGLYLVPTPIGNARDITLRALDVFRQADVLAAEDTRSLRKLLEIHGVALGARRALAYHEHNGGKVRPKLVAAVEQGQSVAYASEAGTPGISDPGFDLVRATKDAGGHVTALPGATAVIPALAMSGLPTDAFHFRGFLPSAAGARRSALEGLKSVQATVVLYESPRRLSALLKDAIEVMGADRAASVCREISKLHEEAKTASLSTLAAHFSEHPARGEVVVLIARQEKPETVSDDDIRELLSDLLQTMSVRDAVSAVAEAQNAKRRHVYQIAVDLTRNG